MCVWLPNWPAQRATVAALQANSAALQADTDVAATPPKAEPIILYRQDSRRGNVVAAANQLARQKGVLPQMPLSQCGPLCPDAKVLDYQPQADLEALIGLAEQSQCYSPFVGLEPLAEHPWAGRALLEPQCLILDTTGIDAHFGGEESLAQSVFIWLLEQGYLSSIAIAGSLGQAWALANYKFRRQISDGMLRWEMLGCKSLELAASRTLTSNLSEVGISLGESEQGPSGVGISTVSQESKLQALPFSPWLSYESGWLESSSQLRTLPIEALRLDLLTASKLHRLGVRTVDQLLALPRSGLPSRFGESLLQQIDQLDPTSTEVLRSLHPAASLCVTRSLEYPTPNREDVRLIVEEQLQALARELKILQSGALRITTRIELERAAIDNGLSESVESPLATILQVGFYQPTDDPQHMLWLISAQLESEACRVNEAYRARDIATQVTLMAPIVWKQSDLFGGEELKHRDQISKLIDHLSVRLGRENVLAPTVIADPAPENSYRWQSMTGLRKDGSAQDTKRKLKRAPKRDYQDFSQSVLGPTPAMVWRRPVRLLAKPKPLAITEMASNQLPAIVRYPRANTNVCNAQGPERIQTGWWAGAMLQRDYYRVQLQNGIWLWCFHDLKSREWFIHGVFD